MEILSGKFGDLDHLWMRVFESTNAPFSFLVRSVDVLSVSLVIRKAGDFPIRTVGSFLSISSLPPWGATAYSISSLIGILCVCVCACVL